MKIMLLDVRLAFVDDLWEPARFQNQPTADLAYSAALILDGDDPQADKVNEVIDKVAAECWQDKAKAILAQLRGQDRVCIHNGDNKPEYDGYPGNYFINTRNPVKTAPKPKVMDKYRNDVARTDAGAPYAGCYVNALIDIYAQDNGFGKRVNATLMGVQFFRDGDAFAAGAPAKAEDFPDLAVNEPLA